MAVPKLPNDQVFSGGLASSRPGSAGAGSVVPLARLPTELVMTASGAARGTPFALARRLRSLAGMSTHLRPDSDRRRGWHGARGAALAAGALALCACSASPLEPPPRQCPPAALQATFTQKVNNELDLLFMLDDSPSMAPLQQKLLAQLPTFMQELQGLPMGLPSLHVAVISSDMGAHSDTDIGCTELGDDGALHYAPEGTCTNTTLTADSTYISDTNGVVNFTDPIASVFQCIAQLGTSGCGFEHQLASIDRALGADGNGPPPATLGNFLRPEAYLEIVMLTNTDDASAPESTTIFSLNGYPQNITNPDGPLTEYRRNGGPRSPHLCQDPAAANPMAYETPPILVPADARGTAAAPTLDLLNCKDNDSGSSAFIPVSKFVSDIKALKTDPDNQILLSGIIGPPTPFEIGWYPPVGGQNLQSGELWPGEMHSCGAQGGDRVSPNATQFTADGSFGDPGIRLAEFLNAFPNSVVASICDPSYAAAMRNIAEGGPLVTPPCLTGSIALDAAGDPQCAVIEHVTIGATTTDTAIPNCAENGNTPPCWSLGTGGLNCSGQQLIITDTTTYKADASSVAITCTLQQPSGSDGGCESLPTTTEP